MANQSTMAAMKQKADKDLVAALGQMSTTLGIEAVQPVVYPRDREYELAANMQAMAQWALTIAQQVVWAVGEFQKQLLEAITSNKDLQQQIVALAEANADLHALFDSLSDDPPADDPKNDTVSNLDDPEGADGSDEDLDQMTKAELIALAASLGIETEGLAKKADLVDAIRAQEG